MIIRRRGRSHRCCCSCGWMGRAWNDLRPAEADGWEHLFGTERIVDYEAIAGPGQAEPQPVRPDRAAEAVGAPGAARAAGNGSSRPPAVEEIVRHAQTLAGRPSPYGRRSRQELWHLAGRDETAIRLAISEVDHLLARHSRRSASTADSEWLELITAKRLLEDSLAEADD